MLKKQDRVLFLGAILSSGMLFASDNVAVATMLENLLYALRSPFLIEGIGGWQLGIVLAFAIGIESYTIHRLLKKRCTFVVPRMVFINIIEQVVQFIVLFAAVLGAFTIQSNMSTAGMLCSELILVICLFYARVIFSSTVFSWFDSSLNRSEVKKAMLIANSFSYLFLFAVSGLLRLKIFKV